MKGLVPASALLVALALAAGLYPDRLWLVELTLAMAVGQGVLAGLSLPRFWEGPFGRAVFGAGGRYLGFLAAVVFSAVEAYAVGHGMSQGAPRSASLMLLPPVLVAALALRSAVGVAQPEPGDEEDHGDEEEGGR